MQIISGIYKGKKIELSKGAAIRPTMAKVREAVFNIIIHSNLCKDIKEIKFLDLFCGTGVMGIEALSRGAKHALFIDLDTSSCVLNTANFKLQDKVTILNRNILTLKNASNYCRVSSAFSSNNATKGNNINQKLIDYNKLNINNINTINIDDININDIDEVNKANNNIRNIPNYVDARSDNSSLCFNSNNSNNDYNNCNKEAPNITAADESADTSSSSITHDANKTNDANNNSSSNNYSFEIVYIDPPYNLEADINKILKRLYNNQWISPESLIIIEHSKAINIAKKICTENKIFKGDMENNKIKINEIKNNKTSDTVDKIDKKSNLNSFFELLLTRKYGKSAISILALVPAEEGA